MPYSSLKNNYLSISKKFGGPYYLEKKGIPKSIIATILKGSIPSGDKLLLVATVLGVTVEELVKSKDAKNMSTLLQVTALSREELAAELGCDDPSLIIKIETNQAEITTPFRKAMDERFGYLYQWIKREGVEYIVPNPEPHPTAHDNGPPAYIPEEKVDAISIDVYKEMDYQELFFNIRRLNDETFSVLIEQIRDWLKLEKKEWFDLMNRDLSEKKNRVAK